MANGTLVFIEQRDGHIKKASLETLCQAKKLNNAGPVSAVIVGEKAKELAAQVSKYAPEKIYVLEGGEYSNYSTEAYTDALDKAIKTADPKFVFAAHTAMAKDLIPRVAARNDAACISDVMEFQAENGCLNPVRPMYSGKCYGMYDIKSAIGFITIRPNVFAVDAPQESHQSPVEELKAEAKTPRAKVTEIHKSEGQKLELGEASIVVSGGRGIKGPENWNVLQELCDAMGGALGASRAVVDAGWIDHQFQVGQTGKTVSPQLYIACGISGAIQHLAGMSSSKIIVAINKDKDAPIFKYANYGVVGDMFEILPKVTAEVKKMKEGQ